MIRIILCLGLLGATLAADHDLFKNCSRVDFCHKLRARPPTDLYTTDEANISIRGPIALINLETTDPAYDSIILQITLLESGVLRLEEIKSERYRLKDALIAEPAPSKNGFKEESDSAKTILSYGDNNQVVIQYSPLQVKFTVDNESRMELSFDRMVFEGSAFAFGVRFPLAEQLYGIHEHAESLALPSTEESDPFRLRNLDVPGYEVHSPMALYGAVPVLYAHGETSTTGIFLHNAAEQWYDIRNGQLATEAYIMVESAAFDLFLLLGPTPRDVVRQYTNLTGTAHLPQLWALGYHQCRWNYDTQEDVKDVVANFNTHQFPMDVIWLDIEYTDAKKYFTWNPVNFSDPEEMQRNISATHKKLITIIDPHIKVDDGYEVYEQAKKLNLFVKFANGSDFEGDCWPGKSSYMDFLNPEARKYYSSYYSYDDFPHTTPVLAGIWNDMNEPSVFDDNTEKTFPGDALHTGGVIHRDVHNIYGLLQTRSTHEGLLARDNSTKRPFILSRSHFAGTQRYSAIWTGDNTADWSYLLISYAECLNANLLGIVFCGADVGGFDGEPSVELLQRWYQAGAWLPFYRAHANMGTNRREPYLFDEQVQTVIRNALKLRYRHLPVWYTLFFEHTRTGDPVIRPIFYHYPREKEAYKIDNQLLVGESILVTAVAEPAVNVLSVYFPGSSNDSWFDINSDTVVKGGSVVDRPITIDSIPVFYKSGSVVVTKDVERLSSEEMIEDGHTVYCQLDKISSASGTIYVDDFQSFNYVNNFEYSYLKIEAQGTMIKISNIDNFANSEDFSFVISNIIVRSESSESFNESGVGNYNQKMYTHDSQQRSLLSLTKDKQWSKLEIVLE